jgi:hypothetical protein
MLSASGRGSTWWFYAYRSGTSLLTISREALRFSTAVLGSHGRFITPCRIPVVLALCWQGVSYFDPKSLYQVVHQRFTETGDIWQDLPYKQGVGSSNLSPPTQKGLIQLRMGPFWRSGHADGAHDRLYTTVLLAEHLLETCGKTWAAPQKRAVAVPKVSGPA